MKGWTDTRRMPQWQIVIIIAIFFEAALLQGSAGAENVSFGESLILNVYLDNTGKALVTGYADNISGLDFLDTSDTSQYRFENDTRQLYALTDGLTTKNGDLWTLRFDAHGIFDDYRVTFYLPGDMRLGMINASTGLGYLLSASNESLVADVQGYDVSNPMISIQYQQPLAAASPLSTGITPGYLGSDTSLTILLIAIALLVMGFALAVAVWRRRDYSFRGPSPAKTESVRPDAQSPLSQTSLPQMPEPFHPENSPSDPVGSDSSSPLSEASSTTSSPEDNGVYFANDSQSSAADGPGAEALPDAQDTRPRESQPSSEPSRVLPSDAQPSREGADASGSEVDDAMKNGITVSSEMEAVMQTLTAREQAVMKTLIDHGGRMTQAEIRYETRTPKSSLTGILISLERRKLITKKEWGRTNIIELSAWFLSQREHS